MKANKKRLSALALTAAMALSTLAGCSSASKNTPTAAGSGETTAKAQETIEISFTWWGDTKRNEVYGAVCDLFEAQNPGIKVIREPAAFSEYWDKLSTRIAGGNAPDVMGVHANFGSDIAQRGILADIQPYIDNGTFDTANIEDSLIESSKIGDLLCIIPQGITVECMYVNKTLLDEAGVYLGLDFAGGNATFTYKSFVEAAKTFTEAASAKGMNDVYFGTPGPTENVAALQYYSRTSTGGTDLYKNDGGLGISEQGIADWFTIHKTLIDNGYAPDAASTLEDTAAPLEDRMFTKGKMVIQSTSANQYSQYKNQMPDAELYLIPFPIAEDGSQYNALVASHFGISNQSDQAHKDAAAKFLSFFFNNEDAVKIFKLEQGVPINTKNAEAVAGELDELSAFVINYVNDQSAKGARFWVYPPAGSSEFSQLLATAAQKVTYGEASPEEAAKQLYSEFQP